MKELKKDFQISFLFEYIDTHPAFAGFLFTKLTVSINRGRIAPVRKHIFFIETGGFMRKKGNFIVIEGPMGVGKNTLAAMLAEYLRGGLGLKVFLTAEPTKNNAETGEEANCFGLFIRKLIEGRADRSDELNMANSLRSLSDRMFDDRGERMGKWAKALRNMAESLATKKKLTELQTQLIFLLDREMHIPLIRQKIAEGYIVIDDRYELSTYVHYRSETGSETDILKNWQYPLLGETYLKPDYCFLFDAPSRVIWKRQKSSGKVLDKYETKFQQVDKKVRLYRKAGKIFRNTPKDDPRHKYPIIRIDANHSPHEVLKKMLSFLSL
jgi:thymidylate kinase